MAALAVTAAGVAQVTSTPVAVGVTVSGVPVSGDAEVCANAAGRLARRKMISSRSSDGFFNG